ncbi:hypothetical protein [Escherichia coli]|uniref:hypothetical protein n=1 Tax=Escherichia coli TaxID=562 RepID=UPI000E216E04|nr:hypothetical protein [Escherichia coli]
MSDKTVTVCVYDDSTGEILWNTTCPESAAEIQTSELDGREGIIVDSDVNGKTNYVVDGTITPRPVFEFNKTTILADGEDSAVISDMPACKITVDGEEYEHLGGDFEITSDMAGNYNFVIVHFPYQNFKASVTAVEVQNEA